MQACLELVEVQPQADHALLEHGPEGGADNDGRCCAPSPPHQSHKRPEGLREMETEGDI